MNSNISKNATSPVSFVGTTTSPVNYVGSQNLPQPACSPSQHAIDQMAIETHRTNSQAYLIGVRAGYEEKRDERRLSRKINYDLSTSVVSEDANGELRVYCRLADGKEVSSQSLFSEKHLSLTTVEFEERDGEIYLLSWQGCEAPVILHSLRVGEFIQALTNNGVTLAFGRDKQRDLVALILSYLSMKADSIVLPRTLFGWYKDSQGGWLFFNEQSPVYAVIRGCYDEA